MNTKSANLLCLDVGTKTCGLARTDTLGMTVQPIKTLRYEGIHRLGSVFIELTNILKEHDSKKIIIGFPLNMDGTEGPQAQKVKDFVGAFKNHLKKSKINPDDFEWIYFDERKSSKYADEFLVSQDVSRKKRKQVIDTMAAVFILQNYLEEIGEY